MDSREVPAAAGLAVREVTVAFGGIKALEDVSVEVSAREVVGVIGPNGAGKTTLFNVICGFVAPDSGTLSWRERPLGNLRPDRLASLGIARTLQGVGLFSQLTVLENVMTGPDRFRRGLYTYFWRATPHPSLVVFDAPDATRACTRRMRSARGPMPP